MENKSLREYYLSQDIILAKHLIDKQQIKFHNFYGIKMMIPKAIYYFINHFGCLFIIAMIGR